MSSIVLTKDEVDREGAVEICRYFELFLVVMCVAFLVEYQIETILLEGILSNCEYLN